MDNNLQKILDSKGIKKSWLARKLKVSNQSVTNWVKGYNYPDIEKAKKLSEVLGKSIEEIFFTKPVDVTININSKK